MGDVVEIRAVGSTITVWVNGTIVQTATDEDVTGNYVAGIARTSAAASFALDDIVWASSFRNHTPSKT